jgi:transcriptional regulator with XRE-family HTH domain
MSPEKAFGQVLRETRQSLEISQEKLGLDSGYHRTYISLLERGEKSPTLTTIYNLSKTLDVRPSVMIERVEQLVDPSSFDVRKERP